MKFTPALIFGAAVLIAALPVRADTISYNGVSSDSTTTNASATTFRSSVTQPVIPSLARVSLEPLSVVAPVWVNKIADRSLADEFVNTTLSTKTPARSVNASSAPQIEERLSDPTPAVASIGGFEQDSAFASWASEPSFVLGTLVPTDPDTGLHSSTFTELRSGDPALPVFATEATRRRIEREHGKEGYDGGNHSGQAGSPSVSVSEPAALPLLLFGLAAVGMLALRRHAFPASA
jgi:hypothetical protein